MTNKAVFLDRDGTLVHPRHYPSRPQDLCLYEGVCEELRDLQQAGLQLVVVTNQSGIARGYFTKQDLQRMHAYLAQQLASHGVQLQAIYYCPHHPDGIVPGLSRRCDCRKPAPGMLLQAASDLRLDLQACWFVGDILDDIEAGNSAGCRTILVDLGTERLPERAIRRPRFVARSTVHALRIIKDAELQTQIADVTYCPPSWLSSTDTSSRTGASFPTLAVAQKEHTQ